MKRFYTFVKAIPVILLLSSPLAAQNSSAVPDNIRASYSIDRFGDGIINEMIYGIPLPAPKVTGDTYINQEWLNGRILLYANDKPIDGYPIRYDLEKQELEIKSKDGIKVVGGKQIRSFSIERLDALSPSIFVNAKSYKFTPGSEFDGFLEIVEDGNLAFLSGHSVKVKRPDYNEALNVGNRDYKIYKTEKFFFVTSGVANEIPSKKKDFLNIFPLDKRKKLDALMRSEGLNPSKREDLTIIFRTFNSW